MGNRYLSADIDPAISTNLKRAKAQALALVRREFGADPDLHDDAEIAILADYDGMDATSFLNQLCTFSLVLNHLEQKETCQEMASLLATLLRVGIYKVSIDALEAVTVFQNGLKIKAGNKVTLVGSMNNELLTIVALAKENRLTEHRLSVAEKLIDAPTQENFQSVSDAYQLPLKDTERIIFLTRTFFSDQENFIHSAFEMSLSELARHGRHAFELSWCRLKGVEKRSNRVAFLNALQHLISRMQGPKQALRILLCDFCRFPSRVLLWDRNTMMLANVLLRTYNKELDVDVEMTPEEVLNVRNGLDKDVVNFAQLRIDLQAYRFATKIRKIHEKVIALLQSPNGAEDEVTVRHLLFLEREIFIFLSLLSGTTAHSVLASALNEYGDPEDGIYRCLKATAYLPALLQQLKIIARGMGRVGTPDDIGLLSKISRYGHQMAQLYGAKQNQAALARTMRGIDNAMRAILMSHERSVKMKDALP